MKLLPEEATGTGTFLAYSGSSVLQETLLTRHDLNTKDTT